MSNYKFRKFDADGKAVSVDDIVDADMASGILDMDGGVIYENDLVLCKYSDGEIVLCLIYYSQGEVPGFCQREIAGNDPLGTEGRLTSIRREYRIIGNIHTHSDEYNSLSILDAKLKDGSAENREEIITQINDLIEQIQN